MTRDAQADLAGALLVAWLLSPALLACAVLWPVGVACVVVDSVRRWRS